MKTVQTIYGVFDTDLGRLVGIAPQGVPDVTFLAGQDTQTNGLPVTAASDPLTGWIGILASGVQVGGNGAPITFTSRALSATDNGMVFISASQTATVNAGLPTGFGCAFKGATTITAGSGVTITDLRSTGSASPWCALVQTGVDTYDVLGGKA